MSLRVVLYAEGSGEGTGTTTRIPAPGTSLGEEQLGAAHHLLRRTIIARSRVPAGAVHFEAPLRTSRGKIASGSDLLNRETLRQVLSWFYPDSRPDLAVVLKEIRIEIARRCDLDVLSKRCPAYGEFAADVVREIPA